MTDPNIEQAAQLSKLVTQMMGHVKKDIEDSKNPKIALMSLLCVAYVLRDLLDLDDQQWLDLTKASEAFAAISRRPSYTKHLN